MKFEKCPFRKTPRQITPRRLAASKRALQRECERYPLLTQWIADQQPTPEERIKYHDEKTLEYFQRMRDSRAKSWREARKKISTLPNKQEILDTWNNSSLPKDAAYLLDLIHRMTRG